MKGGQKKGPVPASTGNGPKQDCNHEKDRDGQAEKQLALNLFSAHRRELLAKARPLFVQILQDKGQGTIDDLRAAMEIPEDCDPRCLGAVPGPLARKGIIRHVGYIRTTRSRAHAREVRVWELVRPPRPGELDEGTCAATRPRRPDRPGNNWQTVSAPTTPPASAHRADGRRGTGMLFPDQRSVYRDPGEVNLRPDGQRRR